MKTNNVFSDEKLEQVAISIESHEVAHIPYVTLGINELTALLARLEAAETAIKYLLVVSHDDRESCEYSAGVQLEAEMAVADWNEASGKEPKL